MSIIFKFGQHVRLFIESVLPQAKHDFFMIIASWEKMHFPEWPD